MSTTPEDHSSVGEVEVQPVRERHGKRRTVALIVAVVILVGAGIGVAVVTSASSGGSSSPGVAVNQLLTAAQNSDLIGALDAIAPGERSALEPGLLGLIKQLQRLKILSSSATPAEVSGVTIRFHGVKTSTAYLSKTVAAVAITHGTVTTATNLAQLPLGSFVRGLVGTKVSTKHSNTTSANTNSGAIATVEVGGGWYVSIGYTIAYDALRAAHKSTTLPSASLAIQPTGSSTPQGAVSAFIDNLTSFNLRGVIADLAPGEMAALQSYAPLFLNKADAAIARVKKVLTLSITGYSTQTQTLGSLTLVKVSHLDFTLAADGISVDVKGNCATLHYLSNSRVMCLSKSSSVNKVAALLPASLRPLIHRMEGAKPDVGFMTVEEGGSWYVSPTATLLQAIDSLSMLFEPQDLSAIATLARNPAKVEQRFLKLARSFVPVLSGLPT